MVAELLRWWYRSLEEEWLRRNLLVTEDLVRGEPAPGTEDGRKVETFVVDFVG